MTERYRHQNQRRYGFAIENLRFLGCKIWNALPSSSKESMTQNSLKRNVKATKLLTNVDILKDMLRV